MSEPFDPYRKWLGIPPKDQPPNHYRLLGVEPFEEDVDSISNAADRQMAHIRTFQTGKHSAISQKLLNEVSAARVCLLNAEKKKEYDRQLRKQLAPAASQPVAPKATPKPVQAAGATLPTAVASAVAAIETVAEPAFESAVSKYAAQRRRSAWQGPVAIGVAAIIVGIGAVVYFKSQAKTVVRVPDNRGAQPKDTPDSRPSPPPGGGQSGGPGGSPANNTLRGAPGAPGAATNEKPGIKDGASGPGESDKPKPGTPAIGGRDGARPRNPADEPSGRDPSRSDPSKSDPSGREPSGDPDSADPDDHQPGASPGSSAVNLIDSINLDRDIVEGVWMLNGENLSTTATEAARLQLPSSLPPSREYQLTVVAERKSGKRGVAFGLVVDRSYVTLVLDGWSGQTSGLSMVRGKHSDDNPTTHQGQVLLDGQPNTIVCQVRRSSVDVICNGEVVVQWRGNPRELSPWNPRWKVPDERRLFVGAWDSAFDFARIELTPLDKSTPRPAMVAGSRPGTGDPSKDDDRGTLGGLVNSPDKKAPTPTPEALAKADKEIDEIFGPELDSARSTEARYALAKKLFERATESKDDDTARYALLLRARDLVATTGDVTAVLLTADEVIKSYDVNGPALKAETLERVSKAPAVGRSKVDLARSADEIAGELIAEDQFDQATRTVTIGTAAARAAKDPILLRQLADRQRELDRNKRAYAALDDSREKLKQSPDDAEANLAVGRYYCFVKRDWERGLPHLAKASDETLKALASLDLSAPAATDEQLKLADDWWELGEKEKGPDKKALQARAAYWYAEAAPELSGLNQEKAQKRIQEVNQDDAAPAAKTVYLVDAQEQKVVVVSDFFRKGQSLNEKTLRVKGIETPKGLLLHPPSNRFSSVTYQVGRRGRLFIADVGIDDNAPGRMRTPVVFEVWADGVKVWASGQIKGKGYSEHCEISLGRVQELTLRVNCPGRCDSAHAVWSEPRVILR